MKKILSFILMAAMAISMTACAGNASSSTPADDEQSEVSSEASSEAESSEEESSEEPESSEAESSEEESSEEPSGDAPATGDNVALNVLTDIWGAYTGEQFPVAGGDYTNSVMDAPGAFDISDTEALDAMLHMPADAVPMIDAAASLMHMMNQNTFTGAVYHVTDPANVSALADALKTSIMNTQWMCGFPDTLIIVSVDGENVFAAFGNAEIIETMKAGIQTNFTTSELLCEESLA